MKQDAALMLMGRYTYESYAGVWPRLSGDYADRINAMPKYVASTISDRTLRAAVCITGGTPYSAAELLGFDARRGIMHRADYN